MRFGRRDHESYIGGYDPEHEMPDPGRDPRARWQSDAYRHNARDSRWGYRWDPDRIEERSDPRDRYDGYDRDRYESAPRPDYDYGYDRGYDRNFDRNFDRDRSEYDRDYIRDYERRSHAYESPNRENWSSGDFDRTWDYGRRDEERGLRPDRGYEHGRTYGAYGNMREWDRRPDGERYPSDWGWGQSGREWEHGRDFDERGRRRRW